MAVFCLCYNLLMLNIFKRQILEKVTGEKNIPKVFIFLGRSGCGKGTQADLLMSHLCNTGDKLCKTLHVESGAALREYVKGDSYTQKKTKFVMENGFLVPESVVVYLWMNYLASNFTGTENIVFDGCPRKLREAQLLNDALTFYEIKNPMVICINVSKDWSEKRLLGRARKDDSPESIKKRLEWFETEVMPTVNYYKGNPYYKFIDINGEQPIEEVQNEILAKLGLNL